uniref:translation initiation factor IF-1 n=1 Tax=Prototheca fontanea TaxID=2836215 RepID=UPI003001C7CF
MDTTKNYHIRTDAVVLQCMSNGFYKVKLVVNDDILIAYISGKMRKNFIRISIGDKVSVELSPYDKNRGRIVYRYKKKRKFN